MENKLRVSLVIPAHNEEKYIANCLSAAIKNSRGRFFEIMVIDNASSDRTGDEASKFPGVRVVREEKKGLTQARERGFQEARGDILAYIDADTLMPEHWFEILEKEFETHKNLAALSGPYDYYDVPKWQRLLIKCYWTISGLLAYRIAGYLVVGGNFAIKRDILEKMHGFDTSIAFYGEDTNIARRASKFGKVKFLPKFFIYTSGRRFHGQGFFKTAVIYTANFFSEAIIHKPITKKYKDIR
ncbi:glycosyltransferase family 2 protein [Candidatus Giovannonibacteria bacterium]|nr:glycosyltransferase family 2 protein [Candidatus Giovannonibacteria bacterium]